MEAYSASSACLLVVAECVLLAYLEPDSVLVVSVEPLVRGVRVVSDCVRLAYGKQIVLNFLHDVGSIIFIAIVNKKCEFA